MENHLYKAQKPDNFIEDENQYAMLRRHFANVLVLFVFIYISIHIYCFDIYQTKFFKAHIIYGSFILLFLYLFVKEIIYLLKERKNFKNFFKLNPKHKIRDILLFIWHFFFVSIIYYIFIICLLLYTAFPIAPAKPDHSIVTKTTINMLNSALIYEYAKNGTQISDINTKEELELILKKGLPLQELPTEYNNGNYWQTTNGVIYRIVKFEKNCSKTDLHEPLNSSCVIEFDVNGAKKPNRLNQDIFHVILNGDDYNMKILPSDYIQAKIYSKHR